VSGVGSADRLLDEFDQVQTKVKGGDSDMPKLPF
jgi:hypothetical protein